MISVASSERSERARGKESKAFISHRVHRVHRERRDMFVSKILRMLNFVHTSCPFRAEVNFTRRVCGFGLIESLSQSSQELAISLRSLWSRVNEVNGREGML